MSFSIPGADVQSVNKDNDGIFPQFSIRAVPDGAASTREGRAMFKEVEWVDILIAGDKTTCRSTAVTDEHRKRFAKHYLAWKEGKELAASGTPLEHWPLMTVAQVEEFKALRIKTVEQLAEMSDANLHAIGMGGRTWREKAQAFLKAAKDTSAAQAYAQENELLKGRLTQLETMLENLSGMSKEQLEEFFKKPKLGRPKKVMDTSSVESPSA